MNNKQDIHQIGRRLGFALVDTPSKSLSPNFFLITLIKLSLKFEYGFCLSNDKQNGQQNGHRLFVYICRNSNCAIYYLISSKFHIYIKKNQFLTHDWILVLSDGL